MFRKILKLDLDPITDYEFREVLDLVTSDIKTNRIDFGKRTSLPEVVEIAESCIRAIQRGRLLIGERRGIENLAAAKPQRRQSSTYTF